MKLGFTISRQVGNAVNRNYLKRIIREWYRKSNFKSIPMRTNILLRPSISQLENLKSKEFVTDFLRQLENSFKTICQNRDTL